MANEADDNGAGQGSNMPRPASRRSNIGSFIVMDVMAAAARLEAQGRHIIHMEVGQPGTPAPRVARQALARALEEETLGYTLALGTDALRQRIARAYQEWHGLNIAPERIVVTAGSSAAFVLTFLALFDPGARVAVPQPGYPSYRHILSSLGISPVSLPAGPATGFAPEAAGIAALADNGGLDGALIASPSNPTGTMLSKAGLGAIAEACRSRKIWLISDEIYHGLTYERPATTALAVDDQAIVINSFSKYFSMTGWRVGWMVVPTALLRTVERLAQNYYISPPAPAQAVALAAFDGVAELEANRHAYAANRALLLEALPKAGLGTIAPADGAFYLYADISGISPDSRVLARQMLEEAGVAATPGVDFDGDNGHRYIRFSYAGRPEDMAEGAERLMRWSRLKG